MLHSFVVFIESEQRLFRMTLPLSHAVPSLPRGISYWADCVSVLPTTDPWFILRPCRGNRVTLLIRVISPRPSLGEYMRKHQEIAANIRADAKLSVMLRLRRTNGINFDWAIILGFVVCCRIMIADNAACQFPVQQSVVFPVALSISVQ